MLPTVSELPPRHQPVLVPCDVPEDDLAIAVSLAREVVVLIVLVPVTHTTVPPDLDQPLPEIVDPAALVPRGSVIPTIFSIESY